MIFQGLALPRSPSLTPWGSPRHCGMHVGHTTGLGSVLLDIYQASGQGHDDTRYQKYDEGSALLQHAPEDHSFQTQILGALGSIEELVHPFGPFLIQRFRATINSSLLVVEDAFFTLHPNGGLDPTLVVAMYSLTLVTEEGLRLASSSGLDTLKVEETAFRMFSISLGKPSLSTVQAGIILMQIPHVDSRTLNTQLVGIAYDLGLHEDCSTWMLPVEEQSLRKRLAWAVFVQDKWCSLIHGRPSLVSADHWAVQDLVEDDYSIGLGEGREESDLETIRRGQAVFDQMVTLTKILATVLDTFYTLKAMQEAAGARENGTQLILERAKPVQIKLKNWFTQLPPSLKMENNAPGTSSAGKYNFIIDRSKGLIRIGYLHLAYFATEITLHRCIIRSLNSLGGEVYLSYVCRSAAKTRLISAMDFMNRLRPEHLTSFWYFPSAVNFALIGTFGNLLRATAPAQEEAEFYHTRLAEYRWTLCVSSRWAGFLYFVIDSLDSSSGLLQNLPLKPTTAELAAKLPPPTVSLPTAALSPPTDELLVDTHSMKRPNPFPAYETPCEVTQAMVSARPAPSGLISPSTSTSSAETQQHGTLGKFEELEHEQLQPRDQAKRVRLNTDQWG